MNKDRSKSTKLLQRVASYRSRNATDGKGLVKAVILTVDAPAPGKREPDEKIKLESGMVSPCLYDKQLTECLWLIII